MEATPPELRVSPFSDSTRSSVGPVQAIGAIVTVIAIAALWGILTGLNVSRLLVHASLGIVAMPPSDWAVLAVALWNLTILPLIVIVRVVPGFRRLRGAPPADPSSVP